MANPVFTITVRVDTTTSPISLTYTGVGSGGETNGAKSHHVFRNCDLFFTCPDGDLLIQFKNPMNGNRRPFTSPHGGVNVIVSAPQGQLTDKLTTKNNSARDFIFYTAAVARAAGGSPFLISEDPELEDGGDPGGPGGSGAPIAKKKAAKKTGKKKAKK